MQVNFLTLLFHALLAFVPSSRDAVEIVSEDSQHLELKTRFGKMIFDGTSRTVFLGSRMLTSFDKIKYIDLSRQQKDERPEQWVVTLHINWFLNYCVGEIDDATDASIVAAHISTITGKEVMPWR